MSLQIVNQFKFNGKDVRSVHVAGEECLIAKDVYEAVGYEREAGLKAIQRMVPARYKIRLGDTCDSLEGVDESVHTQPNTVLLKEAGLHCFLLRCDKPKAEPFRDWVCETVLPREVRKLGAVLKEKDAAIEQKDTQLALINDDLSESRELVRQLEFDNVGLQGEIHAKDLEIAHLRHRHVPHAKNPGIDNVIMIIRKHSTEGEDDLFDYPYYVARIQRRIIPTKRRWCLEKFPSSEEIVIIDNPNGVHAFNRFEEDGHVERFKCHFELLDLTRDDLYDLRVPAIED